MSSPIRVAISGAAGQVAYSLIYNISTGDVFGQDQPITLLLLDLPEKLEVLDGVAMEIMDCAFPHIVEVISTIDLAVAFKDIDAAILLGASLREHGIERRDLLSANLPIFKCMGKALDAYAKKTVKILVVGNPVNTNALICSKYAPNIPRKNFAALTRLGQNRAKAQLAIYMKVPVDKLKNVITWGNHSLTQFPDASHAEVDPGSGFISVNSVVTNKTWLETEFVTKNQKRGAAVLAARKRSSALSASKAVGDHMHDLWLGTRPGEFVSMGVISDGSYGTAKDVFFSFPVTISNKEWTIVQNLKMSEFASSQLEISTIELLEERTEAVDMCEELSHERFYIYDYIAQKTVEYLNCKYNN